ncbi:ATP-dependent DNA helicase [Methanorbis furvi]|uniref:3'-5' exonuclease DinG n=1 Tax=Methanorbis furvi TaxID=3028299 RepID=A0AAE4SAI6_9EURY|nr:3'-5' exonuclease DinG [Methanocorpusculaceae archaeon Ag1]
MPAISDYFPYESYRPHQEEMLRVVSETIQEQGILMVDAPTGTGKSSIVIPFLAERNRNKIIVAVRTNSQLKIFINELEQIRQNKQSDLTYSYLIGKSKLCPYATTASGNIYKKCQKLRRHTLTLLNQILDQDPGINPLKSTLLKEILKREDSESPTICQYYLNSYDYSADTEDWSDEYSTKKPVQSMIGKCNELLTHRVDPVDIMEFSGSFCPHAVLWQAAPKADVLIVNYHYLFRTDIQNALFKNLITEPDHVLLLLDEAHNLGETVQSILKNTLSEITINKAEEEMEMLRKGVNKDKFDLSATMHLLNRLRALLKTPVPITEQEMILDPESILQNLVTNSDWKNPGVLLQNISDLIIGLDDENSVLDTIHSFVSKLAQIQNNREYLFYLSKNEDKPSLHIKYINPGEFIQNFVQKFQSVVLASGTLSPIHLYKKYYFNDLDVKSFTVPNIFPPQNRLILCGSDISSKLNRRSEPENVENILKYIRILIEYPGNVAVYFTSYDQMNYYKRKLGSSINKKILFQEPRDSDEADRQIKKFMKLPERGKSGILFGVCGGKWSEGLDFKGELLVAALVIGLPLSVYSASQIFINDQYSIKYGIEDGSFIAYNLPAVNKALQALGRVLRTENDRGLLILGDGRYLQRYIKKNLPKWIQNEIMSCTVDSLPNKIEEWNVNNKH